MKKRQALERAGSRTLTSEQEGCKAPARKPDRQSPEIIENGRQRKTGVLSRPFPRHDLDVFVKPPIPYPVAESAGFEGGMQPCSLASSW
jgi:hypothetical protein